MLNNLSYIHHFVGIFEKNQHSFHDDNNNELLDAIIFSVCLHISQPGNVFQKNYLIINIYTREIIFLFVIGKEKTRLNRKKENPSSNVGILENVLYAIQLSDSDI